MSISVYLLLSCTTMWTLHRLKFPFYKTDTKGKPWQGIKNLKRARKEISMANYKLRLRRLTSLNLYQTRRYFQSNAKRLLATYSRSLNMSGVGVGLCSEVQEEQMWTCLWIPVWWGGRAKASGGPKWTSLTRSRWWSHGGDPLSLDIQYRKHPCHNKTINEIQNELYGQDA